MLQLVVFDLDFCVWKPEMYQLRGPPTLTNLKSIQPKQPRKRKANNNNKQLQHASSSSNLPKRPTTNRKGMIVTDSDGTPITVFDGASHALSEINHWRKQKQRPDDCNNNNSSSNNNIKSDIKVAIASCTDEPGYARNCMKWLIVEDGSTLESCFDHIEIRPGDKRKHFESLQRITGIPFEEMCFFDDYDLNINNVSTLGVQCFHTPHGMSRQIWNDALDTFGLN
ncbi:MAG: hypothetical protein ACI8RD_001281 [Bacillariaceae sp.]|jgi:hypothetical protein